MMMTITTTTVMIMLFFSSNEAVRRRVISRERLCFSLLCLLSLSLLSLSLLSLSSLYSILVKTLEAKIGIIIEMKYPLPPFEYKTRIMQDIHYAYQLLLICSLVDTRGGSEKRNDSVCILTGKGYRFRVDFKHYSTYVLFYKRKRKIFDAFCMLFTFHICRHIFVHTSFPTVKIPSFLKE